MKEEKWNILLNLPTIAYGAWTARSVSVPAIMNQMVARVIGVLARGVSGKHYTTSHFSEQHYERYNVVAK